MTAAEIRFEDAGSYDCVVVAAGSAGCVLAVQVVGCHAEGEGGEVIVGGVTPPVPTGDRRAVTGLINMEQVDTAPDS